MYELIIASNGAVIASDLTITEAEELCAEYEEMDKNAGTYEYDFYEIIES